MDNSLMKRDLHGKFRLKHEDYRKVRSLRLTDETWKVLGLTAECVGMTRADYLEQMVRDDALPSITRERTDNYPSITWTKEHPHPDDAGRTAQVAQLPPQIADIEALRERVLFDLKLGKQAPGYKAAQKALNRLITELTSSA